VAFCKSSRTQPKNPVKGTVLTPHDLVRKPVPIPDQVEDMLFGIMRLMVVNRLTRQGFIDGQLKHRLKEFARLCALVLWVNGVPFS
jgi:hypothetical protein